MEKLVAIVGCGPPQPNLGPLQMQRGPFLFDAGADLDACPFATPAGSHRFKAALISGVGTVSWSGKVLRWSFGFDLKTASGRAVSAATGWRQSQRSVGIYGHSQGGTISPLIASRPGAVAFVIAAAAIGTGQLYTQDLYRTRNYLLDIGLTDPDLSHAMEFYTLWINTVRTGRGIDEYEEALAKARQEKWFATLGIPPRDHWLWKWYPPIGNLDPLPYWKKSGFQYSSFMESSTAIRRWDPVSPGSVVRWTRQATQMSRRSSFREPCTT
jgi:hypothetical protein